MKNVFKKVVNYGFNEFAKLESVLMSWQIDQIV